MTEVVDLCGGPGGWDVGAALLGIEPLGIEWDDAACATRTAAGLRTMQADISTYEHDGPLAGLIASPPCPTFSAAGNREGLLELPYLIAHVRACSDGVWRPYSPPENLGFGDDATTIVPDPRSALVLEPLRVILTNRPEWIAMEQVPPVLVVWEAYRDLLVGLGYSAWCGVLNAADYGVPQTRQRAILMAHRSRPVHPPEPTHCKGGAISLFGELAPWVSMAAALGWGARDRPTPTVTAGGTGAGGGPEPIAHPERFRDSVTEWEVGFPRLDDRGTSGDGYRERDWRPMDEPAFSLTEKARSWVLREIQPHGAIRRGDEPAMTIPASADNGNYRFEPADPDGEFTVEEMADRAVVAQAYPRDPDAPKPPLEEVVVRTGNNSATLGPDQRVGVPWRDRSKPYERPVSEPAPTFDAKVGGAWEVGTPDELDAAMRVRTDNFAGRGRLVPMSEPAPTLSSRGDLWQVGAAEDLDPAPDEFVMRTENFTGSRDENGQSRRYERPLSEPSPTVTSRADLWEAGAPTEHVEVVVNTGRDWKSGGSRDDAQKVSADAPAPSIDGKGRWHAEVLVNGVPYVPPDPADYPGGCPECGCSWDDHGDEGCEGPCGGTQCRGRQYLWPYERPATTLAGDPRAFAPGGHLANDGRDNRKMVGRSQNTIRLSIIDALLLQTFPPDYPVQGTKSKQFEQVGNAIPPRLAAHVLAALLGIDLLGAAA